MIRRFDGHFRLESLEKGSIVLCGDLEEAVSLPDIIRVT